MTLIIISTLFIYAENRVTLNFNNNKTFYHDNYRMKNHNYYNPALNDIIGMALIV